MTLRCWALIAEVLDYWCGLCWPANKTQRWVQVSVMMYVMLGLHPFHHSTLMLLRFFCGGSCLLTSMAVKSSPSVVADKLLLLLPLLLPGVPRQQAVEWSAGEGLQHPAGQLL